MLPILARSPSCARRSSESSCASALAATSNGRGLKEAPRVLMGAQQGFHFLPQSAIPGAGFFQEGRALALRALPRRVK